MPKKPAPKPQGPKSRTSPKFSATIDADQLAFVDGIVASGNQLAEDSQQRPTLNRSGVLRAIVGAVRALNIDFSNVSTEKEIAAAIAKKRR